MSAIYSYTLAVTVQSAENLIIADILNSDPYVVLSVGEKTVGRTQTIYRNHVNPVWDKLFTIPLLHTNNTLKLRVYDEDPNKSDFMGQASVNLELLSLNVEKVEKAELLQADNVTKSKGTICFKMLLTRNDSIIKIVKGPVIDKASIPQVATVLAMDELHSIGASELIINTIFQSRLLTMQPGIMYRELLRDILFDVREIAEEGRQNLAKQLDRPSIAPLMTSQVRSSCQTGFCTRINWLSQQAVPEMPFMDLGIRFQFHSNSHLPTNCFLGFPNKYLLWVWVKWLRVAKGYWKGEIVDEDLPLWIVRENGRLASSALLSFTFGDSTIEGSGVLSMSKPDLLVIEHIETRVVIYKLDLTDLVSLQVTVDSVFPHDYSLQIKDISGIMDAGQQLPPDTTSSVTFSSTSLFSSTSAATRNYNANFEWKNDNIFVDIGDHVDSRGVIAPKGGFHLYFQSGSGAANSQELIGHKYCLFSELPGLDLASTTQNLSTSLEGVAPEKLQTTIALNKPPTLLITLLHGMDLKVENQSFHKILISCVPSDWCGRKLKTCRKLESPPIAVDPNPNFSGHTFKIKMTKDLCYAQYIRLEVILTHNLNNREKYGAVLVPITSFFTNGSNNQGTVAFPIMNHSRQIAYSFIKDGKMGQLDMRLSLAPPKIKSSSDVTEPSSPPRSPASVTLNMQMVTLHPNSFSWHGKCILAENIPSKVVSEACTVAARFSGLQLTLVCADYSETLYDESPLEKNKNVVDQFSEKIVNPAAVKITKATHTAKKGLFSACSCFASASNVDPSVVYEPVRQDPAAVAPPSSARDPSFDKIKKQKTVDPRLLEYTRNPSSVMMCCQERSSMEKKIVEIPWDQVLSVDQVTSSILSLRMQVHRYFGQNEQGESVFRQVDMELFVLNCSAQGLSSLMNERIGFSELRKQVNVVLATTEDTIHRRNTLRMASTRSVPEEMESDSPPETQELSFASNLVVNLDQDAMVLEKRVQLLDMRYSEALQLAGSDAQGTKTVESLAREIGILRSRICRLRVYVASLISSNIPSKFPITLEGAERIIARDMKTLNRITQQNEVATINNRIEYLLDMAELHLRDAALCGWRAHGNGKMEAFMEKIVNNYLIEMVSQLGKFFDGTGAVKGVKGLSSKILLIVALMKHNDRLDQLLRSALRPYDLIASPVPQMSLFLDINTIIAWYVMIIEEEMTAKVNDVVGVWSDISKDAGGEACRYKYPLPWVPMRKRGTTGVFMTQIPEDVKELLTVNAECARLKREDVAESFLTNIAKMEGKLRISFVHAFVHLSNIYWTAMSEKDWTVTDAKTGEAQENQLAEHVEWLCSVANDARRVSESNMTTLGPLITELIPNLTKNKSRDGLEEATFLDQAHSSFAAAMLRAADHISCIVFKILSGDSIWLDYQAHTTWLPSSSNENDGMMLSDSFSDRIIDLQDLLESKLDYLDPPCYHKLVSICADKVVVRYLFLLKSASKASRIFSKVGPEISQMISDIAAIKECFRRLLDQPQVQLYTDSLISQFRYLDQAVILITAEIKSSEFEKTLHTLWKLAEGHPEDAIGIADFASCCLSLREVVKEVIPEKKKRNSYFSTDKETAAATLNDHSATAKTASPAAADTGAVRRGSANPTQNNKKFSLLGIFGIHEDAHPPATPPAAAAAPVAVQPEEEGMKRSSSSASLSEGKGRSALKTSSEGGMISALFGTHHDTKSKRKSIEMPIIEQIRDCYEPPSSSVGVHHRSPIAKVFTDLPLPYGKTDPLSAYLVFSSLPLNAKSGPSTAIGGDHEQSNLEDLLKNRSKVNSGALGTFRPDRFSVLDAFRLDSFTASSSMLEIRSLSIPSMAFVDRKLQPYFVLALGNKEVRTALAAIDPVSGIYTWDVTACVFPLGQTALNFHTLNCTLYSKNRIFSDSKIGFVRIPLSTLDISPIEQERFVLDCSESSSAVVKVDEGGELPSLTITVYLRSGRSGTKA